MIWGYQKETLPGRFRTAASQPSAYYWRTGTEICGRFAEGTIAGLFAAFGRTSSGLPDHGSPKDSPIPPLNRRIPDLFFRHIVTHTG